MTTKFYINQKTKRIVKSPGKTFSKLKHTKFLKKEPCLYNLKSAKKCFYKLLKFYPNVVYPSSNFLSIPKTYKMNTIKGLRAFIKQDNNVIAFINKYGFIYRLINPININSINNHSIPIVIDYNNTLPNFIKTLPTIDKNMQKKVHYQINTIKPNKNIHILFNHTQKDFIPINKKMDKKQHDKILSIFNDTLIKETPKIYEIPDYPTIKKSPKPSVTPSTPSSIAPSTISSIAPSTPSVTPSSIAPSTISSTTPSTPSIAPSSVTPSSIAPSSIAPSTIPSTTPSTPSTISSTTPSTTPSVTPSTISSTLLSTPSILLSQEPTPPSTPTTTPPTPPSTPTPETSSTPLSIPLEKDLTLSFINDKLMKISKISSSSVSSDIKMIQDESGNIIGYSEK